MARACGFVAPIRMARLTIERAPAPALPRRFLLCMPWWGMFAGLLLILDGDALLRSRWNPGTLALVHVFTLGVLGNAMFGSVLQFLPAAAGVRVRGLRWGSWLHGLFNLGSVLLVAKGCALFVNGLVPLALLFAPGAALSRASCSSTVIGVAAGWPAVTANCAAVIGVGVGVAPGVGVGAGAGGLTTTVPAPGEATLLAPSQAASARPAQLVDRMRLRRLKLAIISPFRRAPADAGS